MTLGLPKLVTFIDKYIHIKFPNEENTLCLENITIVCDDTVQVRHKEQQCYFVKIEGINYILHDVAKYFQVNQPSAVIFEAQCQVTDLSIETVAAGTRSKAEETHCSQQNVTTTVTQEKIVEHHH